MCRNSQLPTVPQRQRGFSLPVTVFVVVIMALLAVAVVQLASRSNLATAQELFSTRAFYAAESGASWAMSRLFFNESGSATKGFSDGQCHSAVNNQVLNFAVAGLAGCRATLACKATASGATGYYDVVSTGVCGAGDVQATRVIRVGGRNDL